MTNFGNKIKNFLLKIKSKKFIVSAIMIFILVVVIILLGFFVFKPYIDYNNAVGYIENGEYDNAIELFQELDDYKDSKEKIVEAKYLKAKSLMNNGDYVTSYDLLDELTGYKDCDELKIECVYQQAIAAVNDEDFRKARTLLDSITDNNKNEYKDSKKFYEKCDQLEKEEKLKIEYDAAQKLLKEENYAEAIDKFSTLMNNNYKDSKEKYFFCEYKYAEMLINKFETAVNQGEKFSDDDLDNIDTTLYDLIAYEYDGVETLVNKYNEINDLYYKWDVELVVNESKTANDFSNNKNSFYNAEVIAAHIKINKIPVAYTDTEKFNVKFYFSLDNMIIDSSGKVKICEKNISLSKNKTLCEFITFGDDYKYDHYWYDGKITISVLINDNIVLEQTVDVSENRGTFSTVDNLIIG